MKKIIVTTKLNNEKEKIIGKFDYLGDAFNKINDVMWEMAMIWFDEEFTVTPLTKPVITMKNKKTTITITRKIEK